MKQNIIALVYDFDGTLTPKTMQEYTVFPRLKLNPDKFWSKILSEAAETEGEIMMIYMRQLITYAESLDIKITKDEFKSMASKIKYFKGVTSWFEHINKYVKSKHNKMKTEKGSRFRKAGFELAKKGKWGPRRFLSCLLYTSDAADE